VTLRWSTRCAHLAAGSSLTAMSGKIRLRLRAAALFAATGLVLACGTTIDGRPIVNPVLATEPSPASPPPIQTPPRTTPPSGFPQELDPDAKPESVDR
jgi:hypothetical protein